jgi:hypothetical protein
VGWEGWGTEVKRKQNIEYNPIISVNHSAAFYFLPALSSFPKYAQCK